MNATKRFGAWMRWLGFEARDGAWWPRAIALAACLATNGCGDPSSAPSAALAEQPLVMAPDEVPHAHVVTAFIGNVSTRYAAHYDGEALVQITEQRQGTPPDVADATYLFRSARLMRYESPTLDGKDWLVLEIDPQGQVLVARNGTEPASNEEINAILTRAQLLRNHALARRATQTHARHNSSGSARVHGAGRQLDANGQTTAR